MKHLCRFFTIGFFCVASGVWAQDSSSALPKSIDTKALDLTVNPCQNFYQYACGNWMKENPVPPEFARWGRFDELQDRNREELRKILEDAAANQTRSALDQKIGGYYASCMNESAIDAAGDKPLKSEIDQILAIGDKSGIAAQVARLHQQMVNVFFRFGSRPDPDNAHLEIGEGDQGGLGLPDRDYYFRQDEKSEATRKEYVKHVSRMFQLLGDSPATADAKAAAVMTIETSLAKSSLNRVERRNPQKLHNKMTLEAFTQLFPAFNTAQYLSDVRAPAFKGMNVSVPDFFRNLNQVLEATSLDSVKTYLIWYYVSSYAEDLSKPFVDEDFAFYSKYLTGAQQIQPRWKRCVRSTDDALGEALGQKYVETNFAGASKEKTRALVAQIEHEMALDINSLTWMSPQTKQQALVKLQGVTNKIGYPDRWKDYSSVKIVADDLAGNDARAREYEVQRDIAKIGRPVDRSEWGMTPPTVNAYYSPNQNNINFPAGILQLPFYNASRDEAVNLGGIGSVIGHELTHGFDDQGRQFDADGNLRDWWTKEDGSAFKERADCIANEYEKFSPVADVHLNGHLTLGENGADNAGVRLAYMALLDSLASHTISSDKVDDYTPQQRFFLGYAQLWCQNTRPEEALHRAQTDPHSPGQFRVNGVVQNMPEFGQAFACTAGQPMVADNACRVW
ncbi:MAG TPA: M13 family metallopeptidase [Bryobacteraceae bacterium]|jgi:endothelin-converting enzyme/putative endopeptidase|nr:M13 family metallopeptidase [Bryobacteraceae bacterium]